MAPSEKGTFRRPSFTTRLIAAGAGQRRMVPGLLLAGGVTVMLVWPSMTALATLAIGVAAGMLAVDAEKAYLEGFADALEQADALAERPGAVRPGVGWLPDGTPVALRPRADAPVGRDEPDVAGTGDAEPDDIPLRQAFGLDGSPRPPRPVLTADGSPIPIDGPRPSLFPVPPARPTGAIAEASPSGAGRRKGHVARSS